MTNAPEKHNKGPRPASRRPAAKAKPGGIGAQPSKTRRPQADTNSAPEPVALAADPTQMELFMVATPGLELPLADELRDLGYRPEMQPGGVTVTGGWADVWRINLHSRGATRVLARIGSFRAMHPAQLDKRARRFPWSDWLRADTPIKIEATSRKSRIYHAGAIIQRIEGAIRDTLGAPISDEAPVTLKVRLEDDLCTFSLDTSGESLHRRGHKQAVAKAPMRETMAAMFLRECGYTGQGNGAGPVLDPMCGSGTFVIEAAEMAAGLAPGRSRDFAFQHLPSFDARAWDQLRAAPALAAPDAVRFYGSDRDAGATRMSLDNAARAGLSEWTSFQTSAIADLQPPVDTAPGLIIINPPYGARIGNKGPLFGLHAAMGEVLRTRFAGWRVAIVTSDAQLARATGLPFREPGPYVAHGGLKVRLWQTGPL